MATPTNIELWNAVRAKFPQFASHTSEGTAELFTANGYEALKRSDASALDDFFLLSARIYTQLIDTEAPSRDPLVSQDFGETYDVPYGSIIQRLSVEPVVPVSPAYKNLKNFDSPDPNVVYKALVAERFFKYNSDYQALVTVPDDFHYKIIFIQPNGMGTYLQSQVVNALQAGYTTQTYLNKLEALNAYLNSTTNPLQDTQKFVWDATAGAETVDQLADFICLVANIKDLMSYGTYTSAFNALGHENVQDPSRLRLIVRKGFTNKFRKARMTNPNPGEKLTIDMPIVEVESFGGLVPYQDDAFTTPLYPVYDALGHNVGYSTEQNATPVYSDDTNTTVTGASAGTFVAKNAAHYKDPNEDIVAIIADKGLIFEGKQNPYDVEPWRNPRGRYTNLWASSPNNTVAVDALYNAVTITETSAA